MFEILEKDNLLLNNEEKNWFLYKHTNNANGKIYYGVAQNCLARWNQGAGYSGNPSFWNDIVFYGWKNFTHEIVFKNLTRELALNLEGLLIQETESYLAENGYNQNFRKIDFEEIVLDSEKDVGENTRIRRRGRLGQPVIYKNKYFPNIKSLADELEEDQSVISQGLNPNCARKLPKYLVDNGLRYATEEEIAENNY